MVFSFVCVTPTAGAKEGTSAGAIERGGHSFLGEPLAGEPQSVIDGKRRRLQCNRPARVSGHGEKEKQGREPISRRKHGGGLPVYRQTI